MNTIETTKEPTRRSSIRNGREDTGVLLSPRSMLQRSLSIKKPFVFLQGIQYEKECIKTVKLLNESTFVVGREKDFSIDIRKSTDMSIKESI